MTSSKITFSSVLSSVARKIMPHSIKSSSSSSIRGSSNGSKESGIVTRRSYRTSKRKSYEVHDVSESDFDDLKPNLSIAFCPPALPAPCALPGGPFPVASRPCSTSDAKVRECQLRELEIGPQETRPKNRLQPNTRKLAVGPGRPWDLSTVWEKEEVVEDKSEA